MIPEQQLKDKCTPEFIKQMCELAEGFEYSYESSDKRSLMIKRNPNYHEFYDWLWTWHSFPLLIHRALEGWLKIHDQRFIDIKHKEIQLVHIAHGHIFYQFKNYQPQLLTQSECAMLHCLFDIFKEEEK